MEKQNREIPDKKNTYNILISNNLRINLAISQPQKEKIFFIFLLSVFRIIFVVFYCSRVCCHSKKTFSSFYFSIFCKVSILFISFFLLYIYTKKKLSNF